ncbi:hypothetical protein RRG08_000404 [Elysia crispata]|uniref:Uncharacterized protein n=1 Tax=Elysia crispata TaxID=231223 RepID=A0AAE1DN61_9GAST|nr:hypothetical protein RRG08_000404 [Elysia crispata]
MDKRSSGRPRRTWRGISQDDLIRNGKPWTEEKKGFIAPKKWVQPLLRRHILSEVLDSRERMETKSAETQCFTITFVALQLRAEDSSDVEQWSEPQYTSKKTVHRDKTPKKKDFILVHNCWFFSVLSSKFRPGADCDSGHMLVWAKIRFKIFKFQKAKIDVATPTKACTQAIIPLMTEVKDAIRHIKSGKAPGFDGIRSEFITNSIPKGKKTLLTLCTRIWLSMECLAKWKKKEFVIIPKSWRFTRVLKLPYNSPNQSHKQHSALQDFKQTYTTCRRASWL